MRVNPSFVLRNIYGKNILIPICANTTSNDPILFNDMAAILWKMSLLSEDRSSLIKRIEKVYALNHDSVEITAVDNFISHMIEMGLLLEHFMEE